MPLSSVLQALQATAASPGSLLQKQVLRPHPLAELMKQKLPFNKVPGCFTCTLRFERCSSRQPP